MMEEEALSPVKLFLVRTLIVKSYNCLICGKRAGKSVLRNPKAQGITAFITALLSRKICNGFSINEFDSVIDFEEKVWKGDKTQVKWHPNCYATYVSKRNVEFCNEDIVVTDDIEPQCSTKSTRSQDPMIDLKTKCMFCGYTKHHNDTYLVEVQYESVLRGLESRCTEKNDLEFKRKIGGDFSKLPALEAKYHANCYKTYMKVSQSSSSEPAVHDTCFVMLTNYMNPLLSSGRALDMQQLLSRYKIYLEERNYEQSDSYTTQKLKSRFMKHYGSKIHITEEVHKAQSVYSSEICITDVINTAASYKQLLKDTQLIENPECNRNKLMERVAELLKMDIQSADGICIHPLDPADITYEKVESIIPSSLTTFLNLLCSGPKRKMLAIAQKETYA